MRKLIILPLIIFPLLSFADDQVPINIPVTGQRTSSPDSGLISQSQQTPPPTGASRGGPSPGDIANMKAAQCAAVPQIIDTVNKEYKDCTNKADSWFNTRTTYCDGLSSNTSTNNLSGNVKVVSGSTTNTTNSGMTPAECTTQANVTYKTKTDLCTSDKAAGLGAAKTMSDNNCPK